MSLVNRIQRSQVIRFVVVGAGCAAVEFVLFTILIEVYSVPYLAANMLSLVVAVLLNYVISRNAVFERGRYSANTELFFFILFTSIGVGLNQYLVWYFVDQVILDVSMSKVIVIGIVAVFNFFTKKHIVFKN